MLRTAGSGRSPGWGARDGKFCDGLEGHGVRDVPQQALPILVRGQQLPHVAVHALAHTAHGQQVLAAASACPQGGHSCPRGGACSTAALDHIHKLRHDLDGIGRACAKQKVLKVLQLFPKMKAVVLFSRGATWQLYVYKGLQVSAIRSESECKQGTSGILSENAQEALQLPMSCRGTAQRGSPLWDHSLRVGFSLTPPLVHTRSPWAETAATGPPCALLPSALSEDRPAQALLCS